MKGFITHNGQRHTMDEWADIIGISRKGLETRLRTMTVDRALSLAKKGHVKEKCCYPDCFHCPLPDCMVESPEERCI